MGATKGGEREVLETIWHLWGSAIKNSWWCRRILLGPENTWGRDPDWSKICIRARRRVKMINKLAEKTFFVWLVGLTVAMVVIFAIQYVKDAIYELYPHSSWMIVNDVRIPDHAFGQNPNMYYERTITSEKPFKAEWFVEAKDADTGQQVDGCDGTSTSNYDPGETSVKWKLDYYAGNKCQLRPGCYRLQTSWYIIYGDWKAKAPIVNYSNRFCVHAN